MSSSKTVPPHLMKDMYWRPVFHLFRHHYKLATYFTTKYFNFEEETIHINKLKHAARPWSQSEKFMLNLALHLFNECNKLPNGLGDMSYLDEHNRKLAIEAINLRFS